MTSLVANTAEEKRTPKDVLYDRALEYAHKVRKAADKPLTSTDVASGYVAGWDDARNSFDALTEANSRMRDALKDLDRAYVNLLESARDRIFAHGGQCDPVDVMERGDPYLAKARAAVKSPGAK